MNYLLLVLLLAGFVLIQYLVGGARLAFSLPAYGVLGAAALASIFIIRRRLIPPDTLCIGSFLLWVGYLIGRAWFSPVEYLARPELYLLLACTAVYLLFAVFLTDPRIRILFIAGLVVAGLGHVWIGAVQFTQENNWMWLGFLRPDYGWRASGQYACPNHLAGLLEILILWAAAVVIWSRWQISGRLLLAYGGLMLLGGLLLTASRGGFAAVGTGAAVVIVISLVTLLWIRPPRTWLLVAAGVLVLCGLGVGTYFAAKESYYIMSRTEQFTAGGVRPQLARAAWEQFKLEPVWGTGAGTYHYYGRILREEAVLADPVHAHNDYLELLGKYGAVGGALFLLFLAAHLRGAWRSWKALVRRCIHRHESGSNALAIVVGSVAVLAAYAVHSVVDFNLHIPANTVLLAAVAGMLANCGVQLGSSPAAAKLFQWVGKILLPFIGLGLILVTVQRWPGERLAEEARIALREERHFETVRLARQSIADDPTNPWTHFYAGTASLDLAFEYPEGAARADFVDQAIGYLDAAWKLYPFDSEILTELGLALHLAGRYDEAEARLIEAVNADPGLPRPYIFLGFHYQELGDLEKAQEVLLHSREVGVTYRSYSREQLEVIRDKLREQEVGESQAGPEQP